MRCAARAEPSSITSSCRPRAAREPRSARGFTVDELLFDGDRVVGIRGRERGSGAILERARIVIGADGRHSLVAKTVGAATYHVHPASSVAYYTYWSGVPVPGGAMYARDGAKRLVGAWPTNDGLLMTYVAAPARQFAAFRAHPEGMLLRSLDSMGDLGARVRAGERADRVYGTADTQNRFHKPHGPGWGLVGDAGIVMDPVMGRGITDAFAQAEPLARAIAVGLGGGPSLERALSDYHARRDAATMPMYELTLELASFAPPRPEQQALISALRGNQGEIDRFLGVLAGITSPAEYFTARNMLRYFTATSCEVIADICGVPVGTVLSRLNAARGKARRRATRQCRPGARRFPGSAFVPHSADRSGHGGLHAFGERQALDEAFSADSGLRDVRPRRAARPRQLRGCHIPRHGRRSHRAASANADQQRHDRPRGVAP